MRNAVHWVTPDTDAVANAFGYKTHNRNMLRETSRHIQLDDRGSIALHIVPADQFRPIAGKKNILFSMWEFLTLPDSYIQALPKADHIIVPCKFCKDLFKKYTARSIDVCYEGVDPALYPFHERKMPNMRLGGKFRFLWVGAPNPRKGYLTMLEMCKVFEKVKNVEIYFKTTAAGRPKEESLAILEQKKEGIIAESGIETYNDILKRVGSTPDVSNKYEVFGQHNNLIWDSRVLPMNDLVTLYHSAHCFVLPTLGEGWGLTLCEAMATGAPCISGSYTGCADFFDDYVGYPLKYEIRDQDMLNYNLKTQGYVPDTNHTYEQMIHVIGNYGAALKKGKKAADRIRKKFTWEKSGKRLAEILRKVAGNVDISCSNKDAA